MLRKMPIIWLNSLRILSKTQIFKLYLNKLESCWRKDFKLKMKLKRLFKENQPKKISRSNKVRPYKRKSSKKTSDRNISNRPKKSTFWISYLKMKNQKKSPLQSQSKTALRTKLCTGLTTIQICMQFIKTTPTRMSIWCGVRKKMTFWKNPISISTGTAVSLKNWSKSNLLKWSKKELTSWTSKWTTVSDSTSKISPGIDSSNSLNSFNHDFVFLSN